MQAKYLDIDASNWAQYLLSSYQVSVNQFLLRNTVAEIEPIKSRHELFSKYHEKHWFAKLMHMTKDEVLAEIYKLAKTIERLDEAINDYKTELHWHSVAKEELHNSMKPFEGLNLKEIELVQQTLF